MSRRTQGWRSAAGGIPRSDRISEILRADRYRLATKRPPSVTFQPLTRGPKADQAIAFAVDAEKDLQQIRRQCRSLTDHAEAVRARAISEAREQGVTLDELATYLRKSIEWVRQAEKKCQHPSPLHGALPAEA